MISLPFIIAFFASVFFGIFAIVYSYKEDKLKKLLKEKEKNHQHRLYETTILKEIQDRIGYSLDTEKVIDIITTSLDNIIPYSTASSLLLKNGQLMFYSTVKEPVNRSFITQVKANMLKSLGTLLNEPLPKTTKDKIAGVAFDENINTPPTSIFNIPLVINEKVQGIINVASPHPDLYKEEDMAILYKITDLANHALSRLKNLLLRENNKLISLIGSLEDGIFMVDEKYQITTINKQALDLLKLPDGNPAIIDILSCLPNTYNFGDKIEKAIKLNEKIEEKDIPYDGKSLNIVINPVHDSPAGLEPRTIGASFMIHDTTREKSLSKMKEDFTRIIVHELRSPLTSIKASSDMIANDNIKLTDDEKKRLITIIRSQSDKMLDEVSMILDAAKIETGVFTVQKTNGNIKKNLEELIESFRKPAQDKQINLSTNIDPMIPSIDFDAFQIRRVLNNLLSNSLKFTPGGGTITLRAWLSAEKVFISVSDTGQGIPAEKQPTIFSKFAQIQKANATVGTGLGLYISKGIVQAHNGTIALVSEPGKGTTVTITLPITSPVQAIPAAPTVSAPAPAETQALHLPN